jgi:hypothetical protein
MLPPASDIAFDSKGDFYLAAGDEKTGGRILVLRRHGERYDSVRSLAGPATLLRGPTALAFGRNDTLYALNVFGGFATVTAYAPGAGGEAEPTRLINVFTVSAERTMPGILGGVGRNIGGFPGAPARDLFVDSTGAIQVTTADGLLAYPPGAGEKARPSRVTLQQAVEGERGVVTMAPDGTAYQAITPYRNRGLFMGLSFTGR